MDRRSRFAAFGTATLIVVAGILCAVLVAGTVGQILALVLIGSGLVLATGLVFFEVGLRRGPWSGAREERQREHVERLSKSKARRPQAE